VAADKDDEPVVEAEQQDEKVVRTNEQAEARAVAQSRLTVSGRRLQASPLEETTSGGNDTQHTKQGTRCPRCWQRGQQMLALLLNHQNQTTSSCILPEEAHMYTIR
jgi:hypothetical protein